MTKRAIHLYPWDGGTEADQDMPDQVYCGTDGEMTDEQLTNDWRYVTCKRCIKIRDKELATLAADDRDQKVKLFDEAQAITEGLGHKNVATAIRALIAEIDGRHAQHSRDSDELRKLCAARDSARRERDQLKAENEALRAELAGLRTGFDAQNAVIAGLRKDVERLDWIDDNYTGHGGGAEFNLRLHLPCDIDDGGLRHAIDAAMGKGGEA
ncbi:hypothetical protein [Pseudomonas saponiphila]|uniref:hypothetical protein n=1 Tax=Pseudomonas saponiphila TaxID=556534 RepID=UPI00223F8011|nr:hypothetical protein [Pseudomonas saponiphila]